MGTKISIIALNIILFAYLSFYSNLTSWESVSLVMMLYFLLEFINDLGKKVIILDLALLMAILTCLVMPIVFYHNYTSKFPLAKLWVKYMPVSTDTYFSFAAPAVLAMIIGVRIPIRKLRINANPKIYLENVKNYLKDKPNLGLTLIGTGVMAGFLDFLSSAGLKNIFYLAEHLTYVGVFYVIYSPSKQRSYVVPGVLLLMVGQSILNGMFGELIYMLACSLTLIMLGNKVSFPKKLSFAVIGILLIVIIQAVKADYRKKSWAEGANALYFMTLVGERITDLGSLMDKDNMFFTAVRMNQGWLVAVTMKRVPSQYPFAYGETIFNSVEAAIIPRILWPDKPEAGGKANLKRFWGYNLRGFSMNIGPMGEAYANFDVFGGVVFMFFYGFVFNFILSTLLKYSEKRPTVVLWLPFLFFYAIGMETDILTTLGSLFKGLIFMWLTFKLFEYLFKISL